MSLKSRHTVGLEGIFKEPTYYTSRSLLNRFGTQKMVWLSVKAVYFEATCSLSFFLGVERRKQGRGQKGLPPTWLYRRKF